MAEVSETLVEPGGGVPSHVVVQVTLAGAGGAALPVGYGEASIIDNHRTTPDETGTWSLDLERNDQITPAGTAWKIVLSGAGVSDEPRYIAVTGAGPFEVEDILTDPPASIDSSTYAALEAALAGKATPADISTAVDAQHATDLGTFEQRSSWVQAIKTDGSFVISGSGATTWKDLDTGGTAGSRPLDVVLPGMQVGDFFEYRPTINVQAGNFFLGNCAVVVAGAVVRHLMNPLYGFSPWQIPTATIKDVIAPLPRMTVQSGDLEADGALRLRFRFTMSSGNRTVLAVPELPAFFEGRGPLG